MIYDGLKKCIYLCKIIRMTVLIRKIVNVQFNEEQKHYKNVKNSI